MPTVPGRGSAGRRVTVGITNASTAVTAPAGTFDTARDVGRPISGTGIAPGTTLSAVASAVAATLSGNATATNAAASVVLGPMGSPSALATDEAAYGFRGWSPETPAEALAYQLNTASGPGVNEPSRVTSPNQQIPRRYQ